LTDDAVIRIGTRGSLLATTQAGTIRDQLIERGHRRTGHHQHRGRPLHQPIAEIGVGVFTAALREAIHEAGSTWRCTRTNLPTAPDARFVIARDTPREDARDALVARDGLVLGVAGRIGDRHIVRAGPRSRALGLGLEIRP
jgi:hydroxymethylbilane synthase